METFSIAALVASSVKLSTLLYTWIRETKNVDGTVKAFAAEVEALSSVLDAIKSSSQDTLISNALPRQHNNELWALIQKTLYDCSTVVGELDQFLAGIGSRSGVGHVITNFNLNLKSGKMTLLRQQIQSYTTGLQMAMQMINV
jgi:Fungal N-terminal domain of STAND proteins